MVKYVFFDLGLTLVENGMPVCYQKAFQQCGMDVDMKTSARIYHLANKYFMRERRGELGKGNRKCFEDYMTLVCELAGNSQKAEEMMARVEEQERPIWKCFEYTIPVLKSLKEKGIQLGLISNWDMGCRQVLAENGLDEYLNPIIVSSEVGVEKPEKQIFERALQVAGITGEECIYVGDNYYDDAVGAAKLGIKCYIINPEDYLGIEELRSTDIEIISDIRKVLKKIGF